MKYFLFVLILIVILTTKILYASGEPQVIPKDQLNLRTKIHLNFVHQSYMTEELLHLYFRIWASIGLYGPPTIKGYFEPSNSGS